MSMRSEPIVVGVEKGREPPLPKKEGIYFSYAVDNLYKKDDFGIFVPAGALYENLDFTRRKIPSKKYCSDIHIIAPSVPPLHKAAEISVRLTEDKLSDKRQYYLVRLDDDRSYPVCGEYANGIHCLRRYFRLSLINGRPGEKLF